MREPYLALYISDGMLHFEKKLPTEEAPRGITEIPIADVVADSFDDAGRKLGTTAIGLLKLWHKKEFAGWGDSNASGSLAVSDFSVALYLIDRLSQGASEDRLRLIDEILIEAAVSSQGAVDYLREDWPALRKRLCGRGDKQTQKVPDAL